MRKPKPLIQINNKAFTLLESLLVLFIVSFLALALSGSVQSAFRSVQETVFFWEFEELYKDSQRLAVNSQQEIHLQLTDSQLSNGHQSVQVPASIDVLTEQAIVFDKKGGNSSLAKLSFEAGGKTVSYQLYIGSGRYKKSEK